MILWRARPFGNVGTTHLAAGGLIDAGQLHALGLLQQRHGIKGGAGGFAATIPADNGLAVVDLGIALAGQHQNRAASGDHHALHEIIFGAERFIRVDGGDHHEIGAAALFNHGGGQKRRRGVHFLEGEGQAIRLHRVLELGFHLGLVGDVVLAVAVIDIRHGSEARIGINLNAGDDVEAGDMGVMVGSELAAGGHQLRHPVNFGEAEQNGFIGHGSSPSTHANSPSQDMCPP